MNIHVLQTEDPMAERLLHWVEHVGALLGMGGDTRGHGGAAARLATRCVHMQQPQARTQCRAHTD